MLRDCFDVQVERQITDAACFQVMRRRVVIHQCRQLDPLANRKASINRPDAITKDRRYTRIMEGGFAPIQPWRKFWPRHKPKMLI